MPDEKTAEEILAEKKLRGDFVGEDDVVDTDSPEVGDELPKLADVADDDEGDEPEAVQDAEEEEEPAAEAEEEESLAAAAEEEEEEDEPGAKADEPIMIPKSRFDEAQQKARQREEELQRRLDAAEERKQSETTSENVQELENELDKLDAQYAELLLEGETEKANAVRKQWRQKQNDLFDIRLEQRSSLASKQAIEGMRFDRQLAEYEVKFPVINPDSEDFNQDVANEVADLMSAFEAKGWNSVAALNKAIKYVIPADTGNTGSPDVDPDIVRTKRKVAARKKVADVAKKSPPDITDKGRDTDKVGTGDGLPDVTKMTPEQFASLSEAQLRKLRGDTLTEQEVNS